ncbi:cystatin domain-containing protein [Asticcacaulis taihuensis]|uniref:cystatin domain-containing protein n=1 Tax=Asticcacaulis taihuensis TaxID=260084 RepID=UPI003F7BBF5B
MILPRLTLILPALLIATAANSQTPAQEPLPIVGGFQKASVDDADIRTAADFAISAAPKKSKLADIVTARQQVVAGINYSLCLKLKSGKFVAAKVFRDLDKSYKLTSWQDVKTCS